MRGSKYTLWAFIFLVASSFNSALADNVWLLGKWEAKNGNSGEFLEFTDNKHVRSIGKEGKVSQGTYKIKGQDVLVKLDLKFVSAKYRLKISEDKKSLIMYSRNRGDIAKYRKLE